MARSPGQLLPHAPVSDPLAVAGEVGDDLTGGLVPYNRSQLVVPHPPAADGRDEPVRWDTLTSPLCRALSPSAPSPSMACILTRIGVSS